MIIGGGVAGCATALALAAHGVDDVVVIDAGRQHGWRIGESIPPAARMVLSQLGVWNDFLTPLIYINSSAQWTIQLGLRSLFAEFSADYGGVMAGAVMSVVPVVLVFLALQRYFIQGIAMNGLKG